MRKKKSAILKAVYNTARSLYQAGVIDEVTLHEFAALTTETSLEDLAKRGSRAKYDAVLAKVPDIEPEEHDRLPTESGIH
jgi:hypothetical protein